MNNFISKPERITQNRIVKLFEKELHYIPLGNYQYREGNSNIEIKHLHTFLGKQGCSSFQINRIIHQLEAASKDQDQTLYHRNKQFYELLRYGVTVKVDAGKPSETIQIIDWQNPEKNDFYIAEEVTIKEQHEKRPDIVLYINGIALAVLELKNSRKDLSEGIRQNITNQQSEFIQGFFNTIQLVFAGNDSQGLRYGTIGTSEKYYLTWKEDEQDNEGYKLDKYLKKICQKKRFLEIIYNFIIFDAGVKKVPRVHQYFGVKATQKYIRKREGGIIWHTQGSGKSITMVLLAKWILEHNPHSRVLLVTDRDELDKQIERVFHDTGESILRTSSGRELLSSLQQTSPRLICSLIHKFGPKDVENFDRFIADLESGPGKAVGDIFVFVDECHRTQSGKLHRVMKAILPNALFIGFTGTPLLKKDKSTSLEVFGSYIHTYKFNEAVEDGVVLDLMYEARDIDQRLSSQKKVDEWFMAKTKGLNDFQQAELKKKWGTMQNVLSSRSRMNKIVTDIIFDFSVKPRLNDQSGNAILIASSIYEACRYYELFQNTELKGKCAVVTSYNPQTKDITTEDTGANTETDKEFIYKTYTQLLENIQADPNKSKTETYEDWAKTIFTKEPANMKLLIVVSKLLTGFDAPSCTFLYIDKSMQDHGLFQAICRVNRLDGEDKEYGYIVDYMDLFKEVENAVAVYTSELDYDDFAKEDCDILLKDRLNAGKERLDDALEQLELLCEPVEPPKKDLQYIHYFCGNTEIPEDLKEREVLRNTLYKATVALIRAYANIADELESAGYDEKAVSHIQERMDHYLKLREVIRNASGETIDLKAYEADMRHLIDNYIQADDSEIISPFDDMSLLDVIVKSGIAKAIENLPTGIKNNKEGVAETIENNVRNKIIKDQLLDPAYFEKMSKLLDEIIKLRKQKSMDYQEYLEKIAELVRKVNEGDIEDTPQVLDTPGKRALYNNMDGNAEKVMTLHENILTYRPDNWRGNPAKENVIKKSIYEVVGSEDETLRLFEIVKQHGEY